MLRLLFLFFIAVPASAQTVLSAVGGRSWAMANAMTAVPNQQSFFGNPAGISELRGIYANSSLDSRFNIAGLSTLSLSGIWANAKLAIAAGGEKFGDKLYSESQIGFAVSKKIGFVSLAAKASVLGAYAEGYSSKNTLLTEFGVLTHLNTKIRLGFHAQNLTGARLSPFQTLPTILRLGGSYSPISQVIIAAEAEYIPNQKICFRGGLEYSIRQKLFLRTGINPYYKTNHFGLGYAYQHWQLDYAVHTHPSLGLSHHVSLNLQISTLKE